MSYAKKEKKLFKAYGASLHRFFLGFSHIYEAWSFFWLIFTCNMAMACFVQYENLKDKCSGGQKWFIIVSIKENNR